MTTNALVRVSEIDANTTPERARVDVLTGGANRGARLMQPAFQEFNRASNRFTLAPIYADPVPERAALLVREAAKRGVSARAIEARVEEVLPAREFKHLPLILSVDNAEAIATALESVVLAERPVLIYFLIRLPNEELLGFRAVLQRGDEEHLQVGTRFFRKLAHVTARSGAAAILGAEGRPEHLAIEPAYRKWFAEHMNANLTKIVAKIRPESDPFEITTDGKTNHVTPHAREPRRLERSFGSRSRGCGLAGYRDRAWSGLRGCGDRAGRVAPPYRARASLGRQTRD
jgi:hypothetical protein